MLETNGTQLAVRAKEQFALGVGYGSFQSIISDIRDRIVEIQKTLDGDIAKERSIEDLSKKIEHLAKFADALSRDVPPALAAEAERRVHQARLSTQLMAAYAIVQQKPIGKISGVFSLRVSLEAPHELSPAVIFPACSRDPYRQRRPIYHRGQQKNQRLPHTSALWRELLVPGLEKA